MSREPISARRRFELLERDNFECQFCGARPGNSRLHVDHLIPHSLGGSDDADNLASACDACNLAKGNLVKVPRKLLERPDPDEHGYALWKRFGSWQLEVGASGAFLHCPSQGGYWIGMDRFHENDWHAHLRQKSWCTDEMFMDFCQAMEIARRLVRRSAGQPGERGGRHEVSPPVSAALARGR